MEAHQVYYIKCSGHWAAALGVTGENRFVESVDFQLILKSQSTQHSAAGLQGSVS